MLRLLWNLGRGEGVRTLAGACWVLNGAALSRTTARSAPQTASNASSIHMRGVGAERLRIYKGLRGLYEASAFCIVVV